MKIQALRRLIALLAVLPAFLCAPVSAQSPDRSAPPEPGELRRLAPPSIERFSLPNGLDVLLVQKHEVPLVHVQLLVHAGSVDDPAGKAGLASLTADMLDEGAGTRDAFELADALDLLGTSLSTGAGLHSSTISLQFPASRLEPSLDMLADVMLRPTFAQADLERLRARRLTAMIQAFDDPNDIASALFRQALYGKDHPYGRDETAESIEGLTRDDLQAFHRASYRPDNAALIVAGAVTVAEVRPLLEKVFSSWTSAGPLAPGTEIGPVDQVQGVPVYLVDKPGAAQSVITIGRIGVARATEDYHTLLVLNTVLGGSFTSRLNANLREDKGYSYGAGSMFSFRPEPGPFMAYSSVQTSVTGPAVMEFMKELRGMLDPVPVEELERAKNYVALQYPRRFETVGQIASQVSELVAFDLPDQTLAEFVDQVLSVTAEQVSTVAPRVLDPDNLVVTVVGDRTVVESQVRDAGFGDVRVLTVEDVLGAMPVAAESASD